MAKTTKREREEGVRIVAMLIDNEADFTVPAGAEVLADGLLDLDNPDRTSTDKGHKAFYVSFADPNAPVLVSAVLDNEAVEDIAIGGQLMVTLSDKAIDKAKAKAQRNVKAKR